MGILDIIFFALSAVAMLFGLLLSGHGVSTGFSAVSGQDSELFKTSKDWGTIKILKTIMFFFSLAFLLIGLILITKKNIGMIIGIFCAASILISTWYWMSNSYDARINKIKIIIGLVFGAIIGGLLYIWNVRANRSISNAKIEE